MNRIKLIQEIIRKQKFRTYLEIGTNKGRSLLPVRCHLKMAVDPGFKIKPQHILKWYMKNPTNFRNRYFRETSDDFFKNREAYLRKKSYVDIALVDGLHTYEQSLKDVMNVLKYLNPQGLIVMHDCYPPDEVAATPARSVENAIEIAGDKWKKVWCGEVWKTILYLRKKYPDELDVCVINADFGLGIVRKKSRDEVDLKIDKSLQQEIGSLDYSVIKKDPSGLNLKDKEFASALIADINAEIS
jgi:hypothetical protein